MVHRCLWLRDGNLDLVTKSPSVFSKRTQRHVCGAIEMTMHDGTINVQPSG